MKKIVLIVRLKSNNSLQSIAFLNNKEGKELCLFYEHDSMYDVVAKFIVDFVDILA